ncbi:MAG TPA: alpha/beta hydrolase [Rhizomicrobium sp.]|jgi:proline-specific peptidase|nr:alpha/beta hydrolase [Rhizomicrobium sp.]HEX4533628.1 alpha/beta hydrolase [Rhizomicrobium sp.]
MKCRYLAVVAAALLTTPALGAAITTDAFDQLQQNVWYLKTADKAADIYVTSVGNGSPVVFLHGGPGNDFNYFIDALKPHTSKYKFIVFDQRGSLLSPVPDAKVKDLTLQQLVDDLETLRIATGQDKLVLLGHSFGTYLALSYYIQHPDHVAGLVLAGSFAPSGKLQDAIKAMRPRQAALTARPEVAAEVRAENLPADPAQDTPEQSSMRWRITRFAPIDVVHIDRWRQVQGGNVYYKEAVDDAIGDSMPADMNILTALKAHPIPITIIQGDQDYLDPSASAWSAIAPRAPSVQVKVLPQAGHYGWVDAPDEFSKDLDDGLRRATAAR